MHVFGFCFRLCAFSRFCVQARFAGAYIFVSLFKMKPKNHSHGKVFQHGHLRNSRSIRIGALRNHVFYKTRSCRTGKFCNSLTF